MGPPPEGVLSATASPRPLAAARAACRSAGAETTAVALIARGREALALRVATARAASRTLDLQYYLWHGDRSGQLLAREVLQAADRGVEVRILLDDAFAVGRERVLAALDEHPRIAVRLFNGTRWRLFGRFGFVLEMLLGSWHLNRRMHNKAWIVDDTLAIAGGRNIGDEYFDAAEDFNFRDLDVAIDGPGAADAAAIFERYWKSSLSRPAAHVSAATDATGGLAALRCGLEAELRRPEAEALAKAVASVAAPEALLRDSVACLPPSKLRVIADPPEKARRGLRGRRLRRAAGGLGPDVVDALGRARHEALLISPYFVPGRAGLALLQDLVRRGVSVSVVTNSLAATDVVAVHGGYARYRRALIEAGVTLYELKRSGHEGVSLFGSKGASLHTKAFVVDGHFVCVGSFNLDPRSVLLNTEMVVFAEHEALGACLQAEHARLTGPDRCWRVSLDEGRLSWEDRDAAGRPRRLRTEPGASLRRRALALLARVLPIEDQL